MIDQEWIKHAKAQIFEATMAGDADSRALIYAINAINALIEAVDVESERRSDHVCDNKTLSQTGAYQHKTIEKLQERIAELEQENRRLLERTDEMRANAQLVIDAPELARQNERLRSLLQEIYDWTAYKETEWAKKTYAALQEDSK